MGHFFFFFGLLRGTDKFWIFIEKKLRLTPNTQENRRQIH
jgi:hypothetical protein